MGIPPWGAIILGISDGIPDAVAAGVGEAWVVSTTMLVPTTMPVALLVAVGMMVGTPGLLLVGRGSGMARDGDPLEDGMTVGVTAGVLAGASETDVLESLAFGELAGALVGTGVPDGEALDITELEGGTSEAGMLVGEGEVPGERLVTPVVGAVPIVPELIPEDRGGGVTPALVVGLSEVGVGAVD